LEFREWKGTEGNAWSRGSARPVGANQGAAGVWKESVREPLVVIRQRKKF